VPQPADGVTYAHKIEKAEAAIDWTLPAATIERRVRAFNPFPGAGTALAGEAIKVWRAHAEPDNPVAVNAGQVLSADPHGIRVATGDGVLVLDELQRAGGKRLPAADFLRGFALTPGQVLDAPAAA
jgi:methionyl-tRNA formyltransferase